MPRPRKTLVPKPFRFAHNYAFFLHDVLVQYLVAADSAHLFDVRFEVADDMGFDLETFRTLSGEALWTWLEDKEHTWLLRELVYRQTLGAILSDFCHFVFEALCCSQKSKLTVTYALIRKPFRENLFILEWLLGDTDGFFEAFLRSGPKSVDLSGMDLEQRQAIIKQCRDAISDESWIDPEQLYFLRYDKHATGGFEYLWHKATHLITTSKAYPTEPQNFNFIFSDENAWRDQWEHLYSLLPLMLYHTIDVVAALISRIASVERDWTDSTNLRRFFGFILWADSVWLPGTTRDAVKVMEAARNEVDLRCDACGAQFRIGKRAIRSYFNRMIITCRKCGHPNGGIRGAGPTLLPISIMPPTLASSRRPPE